MNRPSEDADPFSLAPLPVELPAKPNAKKSLLEWWTLLPVAVFVGIEIMFGAPKGAAVDANDSYNIGFIVGGSLAGIVISLLVAWVAYRLTRRSSLVASLVFSGMLGLFALGAFGRSVRERQERTNANPRAQPAAPARRL
jgi:hypothetical protein